MGERVKYFDIAKGVGILCIIAGVSISNIIKTHSLEYLVEDVKTWFIASVFGSGTIEYSTPFYMKQVGAIWFFPA